MYIIIMVRSENEKSFLKLVTCYAYANMSDS